MSSLSTIISILLPKQAHRYAKQFASEQKTLAKAKQVYRNTLSVFAVNLFLNKWMKVATDLEESDSWDSLIRYYQNVSDLVIRDLGKLECKSLSPEMQYLQIEEIVEVSLAYVAVRLEQSLEKAYLLGFIPTVDLFYLEQRVALEFLQPIDKLLDYILLLEAGRDFLESSDRVAVQFKNILATYALSNRSVIASLEYLLRNESQLESEQYLLNILTGLTPNISNQSSSEKRNIKQTLSETDSQIARQFLQRLFAIWNTPTFDLSTPLEFESTSLKVPLLQQVQKQFSSLVNRVNTAASVIESELEYLGNWLRGEFGERWEPVTRSLPRNQNFIKRRKLIQLRRFSVELIVVVTQETAQELDVYFEVHPASNQTYLPQGLQVKILDESQTVFLEEAADEECFFLKLPSEQEFISGVLGERCSIIFLLNEDSVTEHFILDFSHS